MLCLLMVVQFKVEISKTVVCLKLLKTFDGRQICISVKTNFLQKGSLLENVERTVNFKSHKK